MAATYQSPGVYRQDVMLNPAKVLNTGVPGFVGLAGGDSQTPANQPVLLTRREEFDLKFTRSTEPIGYLAEAVSGFFDNGGERCYVVRAENTDKYSRIGALIEALKVLEPVDELDLLAIPDLMTLEADFITSIVRAQQAMLSQCSRINSRFAILDVPPLGGRQDKVREALLEYRKQLSDSVAEPVNGALYFPWLMINSRTGRSFIPPSGHIAGVYARTDRKTGVFRSPANEEIIGCLDIGVVLNHGGPWYEVDRDLREELNEQRINSLRAFPGRGIRVWGARTLSNSPEWKYINVRRLFLTLQRWIEQSMTWTTYEPNDARLWVRIKRELTTYLTLLWEKGALIGSVPEQAFYVKCDQENNPPSQRELGSVVTEIGLAPSSPAEFIIVRVIHRDGMVNVI